MGLIFQYCCMHPEGKEKPHNYMAALRAHTTRSAEGFLTRQMQRKSSQDVLCKHIYMQTAIQIYILYLRSYDPTVGWQAVPVGPGVVWHKAGEQRNSITTHFPCPFARLRCHNDNTCCLNIWGGVPHDSVHTYAHTRN